MVREHHRRLVAYAYGLCGDGGLADDLVQESFIIAYRRRADFDPARGSMGAWLRGMVRVRYLHLISKRRERPLDGAVLEAFEDQHREWDAAGTDQELIATLRDCLERLGETMRRSVELFYFSGFSSEKVAAATATGEMAVRKRLQRARDQLRECIAAKLSSGRAR